MPLLPIYTTLLKRDLSLCDHLYSCTGDLILSCQSVGVVEASDSEFVVEVALHGSWTTLYQLAILPIQLSRRLLVHLPRVFSLIFIVGVGAS